MTPRKCKIEWTAGKMSGLVQEVLIYDPYPGKIVEDMWGNGTFKIIEIFERKGNYEAI